MSDHLCVCAEKKKRGRNLQHEVKRVSLSIFKSLAHVEDNHDTMLRSGILAYMLNDASLDDTLLLVGRPFHVHSMHGCTCSAGCCF